MGMVINFQYTEIDCRESRMDILVVHPSLNDRGGSEKVLLSIIESVKEKGHKVTLGTFEKTDWQKAKEFFGGVWKPDAEFTHPRMFGTSAYGELLNFHFLLAKAPKKFKVVILSTTSPWFYCPEAEKAIVYFNCSPVKYGCGFKRTYLIPYNFIQRQFIKKAKNKFFLANSIFSFGAIESVYGLQSEVVYPPVSLKAFKPSSKKEDIIISVGRYNPSKKFETLIAAFSKIDKGKCLIIGSMRDRVSLVYFKKLERLISDLKLRNRVNLIVNCSSDILRRILARAKIYVHCAPYEYFGISVVEAMASGCIPVVYRNGGPYVDIISYDEYGFSFERVDQLANKLNLILNESGLFKKFSEKAIERSKVFSKDIFKRKLLEIVES